ncbi:MAG TPA: ABC transporter substrate-binding protein [Acidimicrobiia bacterium]|jgi:NitT/TauT family transport system substrate-binding protein
MREPRLENLDAHHLSRRALLRGAAGLGLAAATGTLLPACSSGDKGERRAEGTKPGEDPPPETTTIRLSKIFPVSCIAAQAMAEPFLREEGFTDIQYPEFQPASVIENFAAGDIDFAMGYGALVMVSIDAGAPIVMLGGVHVGCWQVFGTGNIKSISDLKGKTISISGPTGPDGLFMAVTLANVGIDPRKDVKLVNHPPAEGAQLLSSGQVDGLVAFPPGSQDLRARGIGRVIVDSMSDRPWSDYFCCTANVNRNWMEKHPVATKRALRALYRGADATAKDPERAARVMVDGGFTDNYEYTVENLKEIPYDVWREYDPADTIRFYALRLKEAGFIKGTPEQIIKQGTDFRYLAELKTELKEA